MKCPCCGDDVAPQDMDLAFGLPDVLFEMTATQRAVRAYLHPDACVLDGERFFIRGVVYVQVQQIGSQFGWGVWAEVTEATFARFSDLYDIDGSAAEPATGFLANTPPGYTVIEQPLEIHFGAQDKRPTFKLLPTEGRLYLEQANGMPARDWHKLISGMGGATVPPEPLGRAH